MKYDPTDGQFIVIKAEVYTKTRHTLPKSQNVSFDSCGV